MSISIIDESTENNCYKNNCYKNNFSSLKIQKHVRVKIISLTEDGVFNIHI